MKINYIIKSKNKQLILILVITLLLSNISQIKSDYCSNEICRRCCQVTPSGCMNNSEDNYNLRGASNYSFCRDCSCDDDGQGCGWKANNFGRIECTSCDNLRSMNTNNNIVFAGCGSVTFNGDIVYTSLPSALDAPSGSAPFA